MKSSRTLRLLCVLLVLLTAFAAVTPCYAYPSHTDYISDSADVLDDGTERSFKSTADTLRSERHVNLALCTVQSTGGEELADYASSLFVSWEIGHGMLLLIVTDTQSFYAITSKSLEEHVSYDKLGELLNTTMAASVEQQDYSGAVSSACRALSDYISENVPKDFGIQKTYMPGWLIAVIVILVIIAVLLIGGYILLLYLEKKKAERERMLRELRRRRMISDPYREGGAAPRRPAQGARRPDAYRRNQGAHGAEGAHSAYPASRPARRPGTSPQGNGRAAHGAPYGNSPRSASYGAPRTGTAAPRRPVSQDARDDSFDKAATVQISTADLRAARGGHSKFYDGTQ